MTAATPPGITARNANRPLVSVGIPTFNRPEGLRRILECLAAQSYGQLEIIVSDNASPGKETGLVVRDFMSRDSRFKYYRQRENRGPLFNFRFVLEQSSGEYFMWAADDDRLHSRFVEVLMGHFVNGDDSIVAIACEAQYTVRDEAQPLVREGVQFYGTKFDSAYDRVRHVIQNGYGNLWYSIYKKRALFRNNRVVFDRLTSTSLNEIPYFIQVAESGNWCVVPEVLFYKETTQQIYLRARWEAEGGHFEERFWKRPFSVAISVIYHGKALCAIFASISQLRVVSRRERNRLYLLAVSVLSKHLFRWITNRKPRVLDNW